MVAVISFAALLLVDIAGVKRAAASRTTQPTPLVATQTEPNDLPAPQQHQDRTLTREIDEFFNHPSTDQVSISHNNNAESSCTSRPPSVEQAGQLEGQQVDGLMAPEITDRNEEMTDDSDIQVPLEYQRYKSTEKVNIGLRKTSRVPDGISGADKFSSLRSCPADPENSRILRERKPRANPVNETINLSDDEEMDSSEDDDDYEETYLRNKCPSCAKVNICDEIRARFIYQK